jgi:hypothetical protein
MAHCMAVSSIPCTAAVIIKPVPTVRYCAHSLFQQQLSEALHACLALLQSTPMPCSAADMLSMGVVCPQSEPRCGVVCLHQVSRAIQQACSSIEPGAASGGLLPQWLVPGAGAVQVAASVECSSMLQPVLRCRVVLGSGCVVSRGYQQCSAVGRCTATALQLSCCWCSRCQGPAGQLMHLLWAKISMPAAGPTGLALGLQHMHV